MVDARTLRDEIETTLKDHVVACWFPTTLPTDGSGFRQDFGPDWLPGVPTRPGLVFQARMTWVVATLARRAPELVSHLDAPGVALAGLAAFGDRFARPGGGLAFWDDDRDRTHAYAMAFGIFAASAVHRLVGDHASRTRAMEWFDWFDSRGWDEGVGLYRENLSLLDPPAPARPGSDILRTPAGAVSSNALLHLVEALDELVSATGEPVPRARLTTLLERIESWVERDEGRLWAHYSLDGRPLSRAISWGHDLEAFHIVHRARERLGLPGPTCLTRLADRAIDEGIDRRYGGVFLERRPGWLWSRRVADKVWWVQAETLDALALLHRIRGGRTDRYLREFRDVWAFVRGHQIDSRHQGWIERVSRDGRRTLRPAKAHEWKACYHETRCLLDARDDLDAVASVRANTNPTSTE